MFLCLIPFFILSTIINSWLLDLVFSVCFTSFTKAKNHLSFRYKLVVHYLPSPLSVGFVFMGVIIFDLVFHHCIHILNNFIWILLHTFWKEADEYCDTNDYVADKRYIECVFVFVFLLIYYYYNFTRLITMRLFCSHVLYFKEKTKWRSWNIFFIALNISLRHLRHLRHWISIAVYNFIII